MTSQSWRHAASVIVARMVPAAFEGQCNFRVLMLQRNAADSVQSNAFAFPGGHVEAEADFDPRWESDHLNHIIKSKKFKYDSRNEFLKILTEKNSSNLPAYRATSHHEKILNVDKTADKVWTPAEHAFKIAALRELFEECGLLPLYTDDRSEPQFYPLNSRSFQMQWKQSREKVHENAQNFYDLLTKQWLARPAFMLLKEWSNWLTPSTHPREKRHDTLFYFLGVQSFEDSDRWGAVKLSKEHRQYEWVDPVEMLQRAVSKEVQLAPPQLYELAFLTCFKNLHYLSLWARHRQTAKEIRRLCPYVVRTVDDASVYILPGDQLYPDSDAYDIALSGQEEQKLNVEAKSLYYHEKMNRVIFPRGQKELRCASILLNTVPMPKGHHGQRRFDFCDLKWHS